MNLDEEDIEAIAQCVAMLISHPGPGPRLVDAAQLADILGVNRKWVYDRAGQLGAMRLDGPGRLLRFDPDHVLRLLHQAARPTPPPVHRGRRRRKRQREVHGLELIDYQS